MRRWIGQAHIARRKEHTKRALQWWPSFLLLLPFWKHGRGEGAAVSRKYALEETVCVMEVEVEKVGVAG